MIFWCTTAAEMFDNVFYASVFEYTSNLRRLFFFSMFFFIVGYLWLRMALEMMDFLIIGTIAGEVLIFENLVVYVFLTVSSQFYCSF